MTTETEGAADAVTEEPPVVEEQPAPEAQTEGSETEADKEGQPKPKKSAKERIDELTAARREAEREAEYWRSKALQPPPQPQPTTPAPEAAPQDKEPDPADYEHGTLDAAFIRDHATYSARRAFQEERARERAEEAQKSANTAWQAKVAAAVEKYPDFQAKLGDGSAWSCTTDMAAAIKESEVGPDLAYHLASNPGEARRIASLSPHSQVRELGKLEAQFTAAQAAQPAKVVTAAPDPGPTVRGLGVTTNRPDDRQSISDWIAAREKQLGR